MPSGLREKLATYAPTAALRRTQCPTYTEGWSTDVVLGNLGLRR